MPADGDPSSIDDLMAIVERLHAPAPEGCPWCLAQTPESLADDLLKESYEVADAIARGDTEGLSAELGDVLLILLAQTHLGAVRGTLTLSDVLTRITEKVIRRHPHIFGDTKASTAEDVLRNWQSIKREERTGDGSILDSIPRSLPALLRAQEMQERAGHVGFDWPDVHGVVEKVREEVEELDKASPGARQVDEFGDLLFSLVNLARRLEFSAERALHQANEKFARRFAAVEAACRGQGIRPEDLSIEDLDTLWNSAKNAEHG